MPHAIRHPKLDLQELWTIQQDRGRAGRHGQVRVLQRFDEDPTGSVQDGDGVAGSAGSTGRANALNDWKGVRPGAYARPGLPLTVELTRDLDRRDDAEKRESLVELRERYVEAQSFVSSHASHSNLEWILGARRNITQDPLGLETRTIELIGLWLQDLAVELGGRLRKPDSESKTGATPLLDGRDRVAMSLRDATERFLLAFRGSPNVRPGVGALPQQ